MAASSYNISLIEKKKKKKGIWKEKKLSWKIYISSEFHQNDYPQPQKNTLLCKTDCSIVLVNQRRYFMYPTVLHFLSFDLNLEETWPQVKSEQHSIE